MILKTKKYIFLGLVLAVPLILSSNIVFADQTKDTIEQIKGAAAGYVGSKFQNSVEGLNPNVEFSIEGLEGGKPTFSILTVQPLYESLNLSNTVFVQGSVFRSDDRTTSNLGLGYRYMSNNEKWLMGVNSFYDREWEYGHSRWSIGVDARSSILEFNANRYMGISGWVNGRAGKERALNGYDIELGTQVPFIPAAKIYGKRFVWDAINGADNVTGYQYSLDIHAPILDGVELEAGVKDYNGSMKSDNFLKLTYTVNFGGDNSPKPVPSIISNRAFEFTSMKDHRLDKVRRQNKIIKQEAFSAKVSGF